jgi:hypothetical protein
MNIKAVMVGTSLHCTVYICGKGGAVWSLLLFLLGKRKPYEVGHLLKRTIEKNILSIETAQKYHGSIMRVSSATVLTMLKIELQMAKKKNFPREN